LLFKIVMSPRKDFFEGYGQFGHVSSKSLASLDLGFGYFASKKKNPQLVRRQSDVTTSGKKNPAVTGSRSP